MCDSQLAAAAAALEISADAPEVPTAEGAVNATGGNTAKKKKKKKKKKSAAQKAAAAEEAAAGGDGADGADAASEGGAAAPPAEGEPSTGKKKRVRKRKKKKSAAERAAAMEKPVGKYEGRCLNPDSFTDYYVKYGQTEPPTIPVEELFPKGKFPKGEEMNHPGDFNVHRTTDAECRARDRASAEVVEKVRCAAEVHRQVRSWAQSFIKPGIKIIDMCEMLENKNRELVQEAGLGRGIGFPTGCSLNHVAAHWTPNPGDETVLTFDDVMKIDFGTQVRWVTATIEPNCRQLRSPFASLALADSLT